MTLNLLIVSLLATVIHRSQAEFHKAGKLYSATFGKIWNSTDRKQPEKSAENDVKTPETMKTILLQNKN